MSFYSKNRNCPGFDAIVLSSLVGYAVYYILALFLGRVFPDISQTSCGVRVFVLIQSCAMFLIPAIYTNSSISIQGSRHCVLDFKAKPSFTVFTISILILCVSIPFIEGVSYLNNVMFDNLGWSIERDMEISSVNDLLMDNARWWDYVFNIIVIGCIVGISEEFYFRGIIQNLLLREISNRILAIIIAAAIFSVFHLQPSEFLSRFVLGFFIGYAYYLGHSIWIPVSMHVMNNILAILFYRTDISSLVLGNMLYCALSLIAVVLLFVLLNRVCTKKE